MLNNSGFDLWSKDYDKTVELCEDSREYPFAGYREVLNTVCKYVKEGNGRRVLDIGFGTGILTKRLYDEGAEIYGIDFSAEMVKTAQGKMPNAKLMQYDFTNGLPTQLKEEKFDFIISTYAFHHLTDKQKADFIEELQAHLSGAGKILIGDVAFETREALEKCREQAGEAWDDDEIYIVKENLVNYFPKMKLEQISFCGGVCIIERI